MAEIRIKNLGPVSDLSIDIKQFNLFIGEQASGKSTICKAVYFFRIIKDKLVEYLYNISLEGKDVQGFPKKFNNHLENIFINLFGFIPDNLNMEYCYSDNISISVSAKKSEKSGAVFNIAYSSEIKEIVSKLECSALEIYDSKKDVNSPIGFMGIERFRWHRKLEQEINNFFNDSMRTYYIPAGRGMLSLLSFNKTKLNYDSIDYINKKYIQFIESIQPFFIKGIKNSPKSVFGNKNKIDFNDIAKDIIKTLKGEYFSNDGEYLVIPETNEKIPINYISSGQQEILWVLNLLYFLLISGQKYFVIIEEPEAHLYPAFQKFVLDFIVKFMNITGSTVIITTHSPYILTCSNNLLYAGYLKHKKISGWEDVTGKDNYILPNKMNSCKLIREEKITVCKSLVDITDKKNLEFKEIASELIDEISDNINEIYTKLFYLEQGS